MLLHNTMGSLNILQKTAFWTIHVL